MVTFGKVQAILDDKYLLISSEQPLNKGELVTVFSQVTDPRLLEKAGIQNIVIPKGELRVVCPQELQVYLVERFREIKREVTRVTVPSRYQHALLGFAAQIAGETKEVVQEIPGPWSAEIDQDNLLGINIEMLVQEGDPIGRI
ncbi:MAG: hypothetical protein NTY09_05530 [bacterium]|nr:hypothetical protein [bacterium]